jgi:hypothetical protein
MHMQVLASPFDRRLPWVGRLPACVWQVRSRNGMGLLVPRGG